MQILERMGGRGGESAVGGGVKCDGGWGLGASFLFSYHNSLKKIRVELVLLSMSVY